MRKTILCALLTVVGTAMAQNQLQWQTEKTDIRVEFFTPSIVHVVKTPLSHSYIKNSMVVTAQPEKVEVARNGNTVASSQLTVLASFT